METLLRDVRFALRNLLKNPGFTTVAVITLALGLGANAAIFSFVNGLLLQPLPFPDSDRLVALGERNPEKERKVLTASPLNIQDWETQSKTIEKFGAWRDWRFRIMTPDGTTVVPSGIASAGLFDVLGVQPLRGRSLRPEDDKPGSNHVVMISSGYWHSRFGTADNVIGQTITLDSQPFTIIGVLPPSLESLSFGSFQIWAPLSVDPDQFLGRHVRNRRVYGRLKPGVTIAQAQAEMATISAQLAQQYPNEDAGWSASVMSLRNQEVGDLRPALLLFMAAVGMVLLIACSNVSNLLLARMASRRKEFAVRAAIGASRLQVLRQLLTESVLLSLLGGTAGLLLSVWLIKFFSAITPAVLPRPEQIKVDTTVLAFMFLLSLITGLVFGILPGLQSSRVNLVDELKDGPGVFRSATGSRIRVALVVSQVALALMLLVGAGLLGQTFFRLIRLQPGFDTENLLTVSGSLPMGKYKTREQKAALFQQLTKEVESIPGVVSVATISSGPQFGGFETMDVLPEGKSAPAGGDYPQAFYFNVAPNYFHTMGVPLLGGRDFTVDDNPAAPPVAIVNRTMANRFWGTETPVGKRLSLVRQKQSVQIVGVVGDVQRFDLGEINQPEVFFPYAQEPRGFMYFVVRTNSAPESIVAPLRLRITQVEPEMVISKGSTMEQLIGSSLKRPRFNLILLGLFASTALLLAAVGVYGVMSYLVQQQTHDIGIRVALGANRGHIYRLIVGRGVAMAVAGVIIGALASFALTRFLSGLLYGVTANDPATFIGVSVFLFAVVVMACFLPARRATRVSPLVALRAQ
jgi:putative ABC transport system permease protein